MQMTMKGKMLQKKNEELIILNCCDYHTLLKRL